MNGLRLTGLAILLVDDDPDNTELLALLLETEGADVRTAANATEALAKLDADWRPALLLLDIGLPGVDGYDLLGAIRQRPSLAAVPAVAVSAYAYEKDKQRALEVGFRRHIAKPYDATVIVDQLAEVVASPR